MPLRKSPRSHHSQISLTKAGSLMKNRYDTARRMLSDYQQQIEKCIDQHNSLTSVWNSDFIGTQNINPENSTKFHNSYKRLSTNYYRSAERPNQDRNYANFSPNKPEDRTNTLNEGHIEVNEDYELERPEYYETKNHNINVIQPYESAKKESSSQSKLPDHDTNKENKV